MAILFSMLSYSRHFWHARFQTKASIVHQLLWMCTEAADSGVFTCFSWNCGSGQSCAKLPKKNSAQFRLPQLKYKSVLKNKYRRNDWRRLVTRNHKFAALSFSLCLLSNSKYLVDTLYFSMHTRFYVGAVAGAAAAVCSLSRSMAALKCTQLNRSRRPMRCRSEEKCE